MLLKNSRQSKKAFTLIELLVVIAIVGILAGLAVVNMSGATESARIAKLKVYSNSIRSSLMGNRVSEWRFDEGAGTTTADTVGTNNGTVVGVPAWKSGADCVSGGCLSFDGVDDYVNCGTSGVNNDQGTVEMWIKPNFNGASSFANHIYFFHSGSLKNLQIWNTNGYLYWLDGWTYDIRARSWAAGNWYHIVATWDISTSPHVIKIYQDGVAGGVKQNESTSTFASTGKIGEFASGFNGSIDEARIYNSVLTASDVREQYLAGLDKLLAKGQITDRDYQEKILNLNSTYAVNE